MFPSGTLLPVFVAARRNWRPAIRGVQGGGAYRSRTRLRIRCPRAMVAPSSGTRNRAATPA